MKFEIPNPITGMTLMSMISRSTNIGQD